MFAQVKERIRKGIPDAVRGKVWMSLTGARELQEKQPNLFQKLVADPSPSEDDIVKDISRTFPKHIFYCERDGMG